MSEHTPGPWEHNGIDRADAGAFKRAVAVWTKDKDDKDVLIASVRPDLFPDWQPSDDEADANARLIAAAPDLLAAVTAMLEDYEDGKSIPCFEVREMCRRARDKAMCRATPAG